MLNTIIVFTLVLIVLIIAHELGHFFAAQAFKVRVLRFAVGFGKEILGYTFRNTRYSLNVLPIGGYVALLGEQSCTEVEADQIDYAFCNKPIWVRACIIAAGPLANFLLGFVFLLSLFLAVGIPVSDQSSSFDKVVTHGPASRAGFQTGDLVVEIDGQHVGSWSDMTNIVNKSKGDEMSFLVVREGAPHAIQVIPEILQDEATGLFTKSYKIGVIKTTFRSFEPVNNYLEATIEAGKAIFYFGISIIDGIRSLLFGWTSVQEISGPVAMAKITGHNFQLGWSHLLYLSALLSVNLGLINLLPIPMLDGGHLGGYVIEILRRGKPIPKNISFICNLTGQMVLAVIFYTVIFNDVVKFLK